MLRLRHKKIIASIFIAAFFVAGCTRQTPEEDPLFPPIPPPPLLVSISIVSQNNFLPVGASQTLLVRGQYNNQTIKDVREGLHWTATPSDLITIDSTGRVVGVKPGKVTITVTLGSHRASADIEVVPLTLKTLTLNPVNAEIAVNDTQQLTASGLFNDDTKRDLTSEEVTWTSSNPNVAAIDLTGKVTARTEGETLITAIADPKWGSVQATTTVRAKIPALSSIRVTPPSISLVIGTQGQFTAIGSYSIGGPKNITANVTWASSDPAVVTVDNKGNATAKDKGTASISATMGNISSSASVTVDEATIIALIIEPKDKELVVGDTQPFTAEAIFNNNSRQFVTSQAQWTSSNDNVAKITQTGGVAFANKVGTATIQATALRMTATTVLKVTNGTLQTIVIKPLGSPSIAKGTTHAFEAWGRYDNGRELDLTTSVKWTSSLLSVATIGTSTGLAKGINEGTSTITAMFGSGASAISGTTLLTVTPATIASIVLSSPTPYLVENESMQYTALGIFSDGTSQDITTSAKWTSSLTSIAWFYDSVPGKVTGGTVDVDKSVIIQAEFNGKKGTTTLTVMAANLVKIYITPSSPISPVGALLQFSAWGDFEGPSGNFSKEITNSVSWSSSNTPVATITPSGMAKGSRAGTTDIQATKKGIASPLTTLTITNATVTEIRITPKNDSIPVGIHRQYTAIGFFSDGSTSTITSLVGWKATSSTPTEIVSITPTGQVTSIATGEATISATYFSGSLLITATTTLTVNNAQLESISVTPANSLLGIGLTQQYVATGIYDNSTLYDVTSDATFESGSSSIAVITERGLATGKNTGTTTLLASFGANMGSTTVTVKVLTLQAITVEPEDSSVPIGETQPFRAMGDYGYGIPKLDITALVRWTLFPSEIARVQNGTGIVEGLNFGEVVLQAAFGSVVDTTTVSVVGAVPRRIVGGGDHTCAVMTNTTMRCWGKNFSGQIGDSSINHALVATPVTNSIDAVEMSAGSAHTCAVLSNGVAQCWGSNQKGQLGNGTYKDTNYPIIIPNLSVKAIAAGGQHTCAILNSNAVKCWGDNSSGQLGDGSNTASSAPVLVNTNPQAIPKAIAAGKAHTCLLYTSDSVECWGENSSGQLGTGSGTGLDSKWPVRVNGVTTAIAITAGGNHTCALLLDGTVKCWGANESGQLGNGTYTSSDTPGPINGLTGVKIILAGESHTCALVNTGGVKCWGGNRFGQLGKDVLLNPNSAQPVDVSSVSSVMTLAVGGAHNCVLLTHWETRCWGSNVFGQLGNNVHPVAKRPMDVPEISTAVDVDGGESHTCIVMKDGKMKCMGDNLDGQLGDGTKIRTDQQVDVLEITAATSTSLGQSHSCALITGGTVQCWGSNAKGQLGNGSTTNANRPTPVSEISAAISVSAGTDHTCALLSDGTIECWGDNARGQFGNGQVESSPTPVQTVNMATSKAIATGELHTCALLSGGTVQCWGDNKYGQIGDGKDVLSTNPVDISNLSGAVAIAAGSSHTCALLSGETVKCWGDNRYGQLGNGDETFASSTTPVNVSNLSNAVAIAAGSSHTCALLSGGTVKCWGYNRYGQLGSGLDTEKSNVPQLVLEITTAASIHTGAFHTCARLTNGKVQCWGYAFYGQLGSGVVIFETTPVITGGLKS